MSCRACGAGASGDALFCSRCGARLDEAGTPERRIVTALFCDLVGSTALAEGTDPEELDRLLRRYYELAREAIERQGGTIEKFIGDAVAALFGFPLAHEDDPERAVRAALDIVERVRSDQIGVQVRVAVETGEAFVHDVARGHGFAAGDVMNTAARLQSAAAPMSVIVGPRARASAEGGFEFADVPPLRLKGKQAPVRASFVVRPLAVPVSPARSIDLVGRDGELRELRSVVRNVTEGAGAIVLVEGEPGIGKSRLVAEVRSASSDVLWLRGRSVETRDAAGYRPFAEQIRSWAGPEASWEALVAKALALGLTRRDAVFLAAPTDIEPDSEAAERLALLDPEALRQALYRSVWTWLSALAAAGPVVLEFEDWHWADGASVQLLEHVAVLADARPLLLLAISRPGSAAERALSRVPGGLRQLHVAPLADEDAGRLLDHLLSGHEIGLERLRAARTRAEGNPYFLYELARLIAEDTGAADLPDTIRAVVTSRVDRLPAGLRTLLRSAAILGRTFETGALEQLDGGGPVWEALDQLAATRLVERAGQDRYRFAHALTRDAVYEGIPLAERHRLHKQAAGALADLHGSAASNLPAIAYHLTQAQDWEAATSALVAAGEQAARIASDDEALQMYRAAIAAHERLAEDRWTPLERSRIDRQMAEALRRLGRNEEAVRQITGALTRLGVRLPQNNAAVKRAALRELLPRLLRPPALPPLNAATGELALEIDRELPVLIWLSYFEDVDMMALAALLLANRAARANDLEGTTAGTNAVALIFTALGRERLAMRYLSRSLQAADRYRDPLMLAQVKQGGAVIALAQGGWDDVRALAEPAMDLSAEVGDPRVWAASAAILVTATAHHGDLARARELAAEVERAGAESGNLQVHGWGLGFLSLVHHLEGDAEEAARLAEASAAELLRAPDHHGAVTSLGALARAQLRAGHLDAAASTIAHVSAEVDKRGFRGTQLTYQVEAAAEYALLGLATDNNAATRKAARRAIRGSLRRKHLTRLHTVHAHVLDGGMRWVLGQQRRAGRSFARAQALAQRYQWHGTLDDAARWVAFCCAAAGLDPPALPAYALPPADAARDLASATEA